MVINSHLQNVYTLCNNGLSAGSVTVATKHNHGSDNLAALPPSIFNVEFRNPVNDIITKISADFFIVIIDIYNLKFFKENNASNITKFNKFVNVNNFIY